MTAIGRVLLALPRVLGFTLFFLAELVSASLRVAWQVVRPLSRLEPGIIAVPLDLPTPLGITIFANVLTLVPGTLSLDISEDRSTLYVHVMHVPDGDVEAMREELRTRVPRRVRSLLG